MLLMEEGSEETNEHCFVEGAEFEPVVAADEL